MSDLTTDDIDQQDFDDYLHPLWGYPGRLAERSDHFAASWPPGGHKADIPPEELQACAELARELERLWEDDATSIETTPGELEAAELGHLVERIREHMWVVPPGGDKWTPGDNHPLRIRPEGEQDVERYMDWPEGQEHWEDLPDEAATHDRARAENTIRDRQQWIVERKPRPASDREVDWFDGVILEHHELMGLLAHRHDIEWTSRTTHGGVFGAPR